MATRGYSEPVERLLIELGKLPGIGERTAERLAYHILRQSSEDAMRLAVAIRDVKKLIRPCGTCGNLAEADPCEICSDATRDRSIVLVVETPKDLAPLTVRTHVLVESAAAAEAAAGFLAGAGFAVRLHSTALVGDSAEVGRDFAAMAAEVVAKGRPLAPPCAIVAGGETTVRFGTGEVGRGGPNQEFALAAAADLPKGREVLVLGLDTDGCDGPTELAGAVGDPETADRAAALGLDLGQALRRHDTATLAVALGDGIHTGATGTNVNDLKLMLVGRPDTAC